MPKPEKEHCDGMALNCDEAPLDIDIKGGGKVVVLNTKNLPLVGEVGLGADLIRLNGKAMCSTGFSCDSAYQVTFIVRCSGQVQVVGVDGKRVLEIGDHDHSRQSRHLVIVPRFFVVLKIARMMMDWSGFLSSLLRNKKQTPSVLCFVLSCLYTLSREDFSLEGVITTSAGSRVKVPAEIKQQFHSTRTSDEIFFPPN
uniref:Uncharacterized protein n=1 Tax=Chenopodium quinoa TaxID=63459 RepID=A0A803MGT5_CHEQI